MQKLSRRDILKLGAGAAIAFGASQVLTGCSEEEKRPESTATPEPKARVAAVRGEDLYAMTRQALEAVGGMAAIVRSGETVFIKPNFVTMPFASRDYSPFLKGECTKVEIVTTVAEECLKAGASKVTIGDGSQMPSFDWNYATTLDGSTDIVQEVKRLNSKYGEKVTLACLDADTPADDWVEVPTSSKMGTIAISGLVAHADRVISIPVAKSHSWAQLTLSLKNFVGTTALERNGWVPSGYFSRLGLDHSSPQSIAQIYLDIVNAVRPDFAIIDASIGVEGNGPVTAFGGSTVDMRDRLGSWLLLASTDLAAADATAARVMSHDVATIKQLAMANAMGLGEIEEGSIEIIGERLDDLRVDWVPAQLWVPTSAEGMPGGPDDRHAFAVRMHPSL